MKKHFFFLFGTRPEAIKLFPVIRRLGAESAVEATVCVTAQHREMLDRVLRLVNIVPDIDLNLMRANQSLEKRPEGVATGTAWLVGTGTSRIMRETFRLLDDRAH